MTRGKRWRLAVVLGVAAVLVGLAARWVYRLPQDLKEVHMRSVTRSLAEWADEHSSVKSDRGAFRTIEVMQYASHYYRWETTEKEPADVLAALAEQRRRTLNRMGAALEEYTGCHFGSDVENWKTWARAKGHRFGDEERRAFPPDSELLD